MKSISLLFTILVGIIFISCSSDETEEDTSQKLKSVESRYYEGGNLMAKSIFIIIDNKYNSYTSYDENDQVDFYQNFSYDANNRLFKIETFTPEDVLNQSLTITYDNQNRIIETNRTGIVENVTFTYTNNTITSLRNNSDVKIFGINSEGLISTENETEVTVQYDGFKTISMTTVDGTTTFNYLETGINPILMSNMFGNKPNNVILFYNSLMDSSPLFSNELLIQENKPYGIIDYVYTLNESNYPVTMKSLNADGILGQESEFYYETSM